ncbi:MAG: GTPase HflX [candidate division Zixibacteria bacterium]|nr:GTPase HflX [candidate division Zixibacteria bacterium]
MPHKYHEIKRELEKAILVGVQLRQTNERVFGETMAELRELAVSAEAEVTGLVTQKRPAPDSRFFIGGGKVEEIKALIGSSGANLVIFDDQLSPAQVRNLEKELQVKVIDRGNLILDIFAKRAATSEAKLQVELAQLEYLYPRLTNMWSHFSKQYGGVGTRGPGETQLEVDRRLVRDRIAKLKEHLERVNRQRQTQRKRRQDVFKIALVGYTNAGKSTIFNHLTKAGVWADDLLFCTLDAVTRYLPISQKYRIVISDTVGFIQKIPHELVASFQSTLDEVRYADLLLHIVDIAHPNRIDHYEQTNRVLEEIGAGAVPRLLLLNKADLVPAEEIPLIDLEFPPERVFVVSARTLLGVDKMLNFLTGFVEKEVGARIRATGQTHGQA